MEIYAVDDEMRVFVNGKYVIRVYGLKQTSGKIQLQSEGAESSSAAFLCVRGMNR
jgi:hypothetical protein